MSDEKNNGRVKGGLARSAAISKEKKVEIAKKGAAARWNNPALKATHRGNFNEELGIDVECFVLDDDAKTAVITQLGMGQVLGLGIGGSRLPRFVFNKTMSEYIWPELEQKLRNPIIFQTVTAGQPPVAGPKANGYDVTILIDVCKAIIKADAEGKLTRSQKNVSAQASIILSASAKAGIQGLVYALAGYDRTKEDVIAAYKMYVMEEAREYEKEFHPELYDHWYRLYGLSKPERGRTWKFRYLTIEHIYTPLAKSNGKVFQLAKSSKQEHGDKNDKIHQFLSEVGVKALRTQIGKVIGIASVSRTREEYETHIENQFGDQGRLQL
ncbi:P63C domain-containing protein [Laribacter hongkongensis]|uniref:P63C domain-containing protein n=1 Tax=Laribacter hongkongensis TaxID=168471 RepID=UPI001EFCFF4B|nr:P63C domain-containing protein [Laribacter hongkongensis]MCG9048171.1 P63C domain-containing protein [Laribacter hongkongensis]MCG9074320.1 P63C domain-containing protein [Laribacter hongkongensis]